MNSTSETAPEKNSLGRTIFKNTAFLTMGSFALKIINFLFSIMVIRRLGDDRFGQYAIVLAFVGLFQIIAELGISQYAMREIAQDRSRAKDYFWNLIAVRLLLAIFGIAVITSAASLTEYSPQLILGVFLYTTTFILSAFSSPLHTLLTANERFDYDVLMNISSQIVFVLLGSLFLFNDLGFLWLIVASLFSQILPIAIGIWGVRKHKLLQGQIHITPSIWVDLIRHGLPFSVIAFTLTIALSIDSVMLSFYYPENVVGWYSVAYGLVFSILFITRGFKEAMVPTLTRTYAQEPALVQQWFYRIVRVILLISLPIAVGGTLIATELIPFLYGSEYIPSGQAFRILVWDIPFLMFASFCGNMTTIISKERSASRIYTINAVVNVILNAIFIPRYGFIAASIITVITDIVSAGQFYALLGRKLELPDLSRLLLKVLLATGLMGVSVALTGPLHWTIQMAVGGLVFISLAFLLRLFDESELSLMGKIVHKFAPNLTRNSP